MPHTVAASAEYRSTYPGLPSMALYEELDELSRSLPTDLRKVFNLRFGIGGHTPHRYCEIELLLGLRARTAERLIERATRTLAKAKPTLPVLASVLGADTDLWLSRATAQASHRGRLQTTEAEVRLLLALAGVPRRSTTSQLALRQEARAPRLLADVMWPSTTATFDDLSAYTRQRPFTPSPWHHTGFFHSQKVRRDVHYDSGLERNTFLTFEATDQITAYQEQPITLTVKLPGRSSVYRPDVVALLRDGRAVMIELKPPPNLACYDDWLKWAELARWCHENGLGLYVGSTSLSIKQFYRRTHNARAARALASAVNARPIDREARAGFIREHGLTHLELSYAITNLRLNWNQREQSIGPATEYAGTADAFWRLIARHADPRR